MGPSHSGIAITADGGAVLDRRSEGEMWRRALRWHRRTLISVVLGAEFLLAFQMNAAFAEDPGDWAFRHRDAFMKEYFGTQDSSESRDRFSVLIFGDYQCETRLTVEITDTGIRVEATIASGRSVQEQLAALRYSSPNGSEREIFQRVELTRLERSSRQEPALDALWSELVSFRLPVLSESAAMLPAVWYEVNSTGNGEQYFSFSLPVPNAPSTGHISNANDDGYGRLGLWTHRVLATIGGEAADAAHGGGCGIEPTAAE
jgi:hypothetical protein